MAIKIPSFLLTRKAAYLAAGAAGLGAGFFFYSRLVEPKRYRLETVRVITGDGNSWRMRDGNGQRKRLEDKVGRRVYRVLHLSDLHLKHPESHKIDFLKRITDSEYDLVVLTGDVFEDYSGLAYASFLLSRPPKIGAYAVLGNHDYYDYSMLNKIVGRLMRRMRHPRKKRDVEPMVSALNEAGFKVLRNEAISVPEHGLHIVGIDYPGISQAKLSELVERARRDQLVLALFHWPRNLDFMNRAGVHLAFGGHTHGGQIRIPGMGALITDSELPRHEASGLIRRGNTAIHISRGLGADPRTNFRFFCPPAATVVEVHHQTVLS
ncbi:MAG TPA: metallophosphoesterase [Candidatus Obscuribacterales bacterium]